ncbi:ribose-phosphate pyrophosphokinase [Fulvivirga sp. 29W222]|uniref:ribose-phosphate diphosphokinase n=1 Tax=Fulvivirga marina TaxID=2494733 RepID=A0A937FZ25_9BACT|nr:ribose-phosphate pyrophosphokinase [Fulvivirga marina]MBL6448750.1 ribose-phosphate pyrophosphokinase [Fulvivirga marina]
MRLFALHPTDVLGKEIARHLNRPLDWLEERNFEDGEHKIRPMVSVRNEDVFVIHTLASDQEQSVNDKLCKLLFFIATLKDAGARSVTAIVPYMCYSRKDRRTKPRDPVTLRYVATLFEAVGTDCVVAMDVHNLQAYQNAFRCMAEHLEAHHLFINYCLREVPKGAEVVVMSPDIGGVKRAERFRDKLVQALSSDVGFAFMEKQRSQGIVKGETIVGDVQDKFVVILDDLISSGTTMARAARACKMSGAKQVHALATHGAFAENGLAVFKEESLDKVVVTNSMISCSLNEELTGGKLEILDSTPFLAEVVKKLGSGGSLVSLVNAEWF